MSARERKLAILKGAAFRYYFDREIYFNRQSRKIFSREAIEDNDVDWLQRCIEENTTEWAFYFNGEPSQAVKDSLVRELS